MSTSQDTDFQSVMARVLANHTIDPSKVEKELIVENEHYKFKGKPDVVTEEGWILDWKFPLTPWTQKKFDSYVDPQAISYAFLASELGLCSTGVRGVQFVVFTETMHNIWEAQVFVTIPTVAQMREIEREVRLAYRNILDHQRMDIWPESPSKWNCRFCNYKNNCPIAIT